MTPGHLDSLSHAISSAGSPAFYEALLVALQYFAPMERLRASTFRPAEGLTPIGGVPAAPARRLSPMHEAESTALVELHRRTTGRSVVLRPLGPSDLAEAGAGSGVGYAWKHGETLYLLDLYREPKQPAFDAAELRQLSDAARFVASIVGVHATRHRVKQAVSGARRDEIAEQVVKFLGAGLTRREAEVVSRIVMGMRTEAIAGDLKIKAATVITFRKRAYAKLGVGRQAELFARCVQVFSDLQPNGGTPVH
jgi:DNA-binding CsgD family transcriptional regulator